MSTTLRAKCEAELRAKYTAEELQALGEKGHAFKNNDGTYSYPIDDVADLKNAIRAVGRGNADHDAIRKYVIGRAKDLGQSDLIPENWNADGSLSDEAKSARWDAEHRDGMSYGDLQDLLSEALTIKFCGSDDWCWVQDFTDTDVVFSINGETKQIAYSTDGEDTVTFTGQAVPVTSKTTWVPTQINVQSNSGRTTNTVRNKKPRHRSGLPSSLEVRHFVANGLELRDDSESNIFQLVGKPIQYNVGYQVRDMLGTFEETMHPGVCADLLATGSLDCRFLFNHTGLPLGRTLSGTLTLRDTPDYLESVVDLDPRQQLATDVAVAVQRGDVTQMSVGMIVGDDKWDARQEHRDIYKLKDLQDVSAVTYPASTTTDIAVAQRMLMEMPVESRERLHKVWSITRDLHDGVVLTPEQVDLLSDAVRALATVEDMEIVEPVEDERSEDADVVSLVTDALTEVERAKRAAGTVEKWAAIADLRLAVIDIFTELRANPTPQDKGIATKIKAAHQAVADAIHAQMGDTDNASDPVDAAVMGALQNAHKALGKATVAQSIDGAPDALRCAACQRDNTADSSFCAGCGAPLNVGGPDGTVGNQQTGGSGNDASGANDASGRTRMTTAELRRRDELARIEREKRARGNAA